MNPLSSRLSRAIEQPHRNIDQMVEMQAWTRSQLRRHRFVTPHSAIRAEVEAFRRLRVEIASRVGSGSCLLQIASPLGGSGCSYVAQNLAASFALDSQRTALLIDGHLARPAFDPVRWGLSLQPLPGLVELLDGAQRSVSEVIVPTGIPRLRLVPAGRTETSRVEYFGSPLMPRAFMEMKRRYRDRAVIIDSPPIHESADGQILSQLVDAVVLVVPEFKCPRSLLAEVVARIDPAKFIGCVFNRLP